MPTVRAILSLAPGFEIRDPCPVLKDSSNQRLQTKIKLFHGTRSTEHESRQFLLHVGDEVADVGAAIEQLVHPGHYSLPRGVDRKSTRLNSSHGYISYAVFCLKKKK